MAHTDAVHCLSMPFVEVVYFHFPVKGVSFPIISFIIPPLFELTSAPGVYHMLVYFFLAFLCDPGVIWYPPTVSLGGGGGDDGKMR